MYLELIYYVYVVNRLAKRSFELGSQCVLWTLVHDITNDIFCIVYYKFKSVEKGFGFIPADIVKNNGFTVPNTNLKPFTFILGLH